MYILHKGGNKNMFNMNNKKTRKIIIIILVLAMILPLIISALV